MIYLTYGAPGARGTFPPPARPLSLETTGDPRSATSASPQGCVGQGMGSMPMLPCVLAVSARRVLVAQCQLDEDPVLVQLFDAVDRD